MTRERRSSRTIDVVYRFDPDRPARRRAPRSPREAQAKLTKGNRSFAHLLDSPGSARVIPLDPSDVGHGLEPGVAPVQRPFAAVLGCSDARVPIETIFQQKSNDLFVVRVAGNGVGIGGLGSLRYAVDHFPGSLKLIVVLGHSQCGAVTSAVDVFLRPALYLPLAANYPLRSIVDSILVSVRSASLALEAVHGARRDASARLPGRPHRDLGGDQRLRGRVRAQAGAREPPLPRALRHLRPREPLRAPRAHAGRKEDPVGDRPLPGSGRRSRGPPRSPPRSPAARASPPSSAREGARAGAELPGRVPLEGRRRAVGESARRRVGNGNQHRADEQGRARVRGAQDQPLAHGVDEDAGEHQVGDVPVGAAQRGARGPLSRGRTRRGRRAVPPSRRPGPRPRRAATAVVGCRRKRNRPGPRSRLDRSSRNSREKR